MIGKIAIVTFAAAAGAAGGYWAALKPSVEERVVATGESAEPRGNEPIADVGEASAMNALRARVRELEAKLAEKEAANAPWPAEAAKGDAERPAVPGMPKMSDIRSRIEAFRRDHPEESARIEKRMNEMRRHRVERANGRLDFLRSVGTDGMSEEGRRNHARLQELIARQQELQAKLEDFGIGDGERSESLREMFELRGELNEANEIERASLLGQMLGELGLGEDDAAEVSETIGTIYDATTEIGPSPFGFPHRRHGGAGSRR